MNPKGVSSYLSSSSWEKGYLNCKTLFSLRYPGGILIFFWALELQLLFPHEVQTSPQNLAKTDSDNNTNIS